MGENPDPQASHRRLRVFLCHATFDKPIVRSLYHRLRADGIQPWFDEEDLLPGQEWRDEIPKAVRACDVVIVCLSRRSVTKVGYVQKEIKYALDVADEQPEGAIFIIPVKLEECEVPRRLSHWQWASLFVAGGYEHLLRALRARSRALGVEPSVGAVDPGEVSSPRGSRKTASLPAPGKKEGVASSGQLHQNTPTDAGRDDVQAMGGAERIRGGPATQEPTREQRHDHTASLSHERSPTPHASISQEAHGAPWHPQVEERRRPRNSTATFKRLMIATSIALSVVVVLFLYIRLRQTLFPPGNSVDSTSGPSAKISTSPAELVFEVSDPATLVRRTLEISNKGDAPLTVEVVVNGTGFSLDSESSRSFRIQPHRSTQVSIAYNAQATPGALQGTAIVQSNDPAHPRMAVRLTATSQAQRAIQGTAGTRGSYVTPPLPASAHATLSELSFHDTPGSATHVCVSGNTAYVADSRAGLRILDVSNPSHPQEIGALTYADDPRLGLIYDVVCRGSLLYATERPQTDNPGGLWIIDVSRPTHPVIAGTYQESDYLTPVSGLAVSGSKAYIMLGHAGARVLDVSDSSNPRSCSYIPARVAQPHPSQAAVDGTHLYINGDVSGLQVFEIIDPCSPRKISELPAINPVGGNGICVRGSYAYLAGKNGGLRIVDISDSRHPREIGRYATTGSANDVVVSGEIAYVACSKPDEIDVLDVSVGSTPRLIGHAMLPGEGLALCLEGRLCLVAASAGGLGIFRTP
jgi:hypothetical protein